jgi:RNA polymerase sigma-70 factor (ECF subfamily)
MQRSIAYLDRPDRLLVDWARNGDDDAFGELVCRHYRRCVELASLILRNDWDAEDQVQTACSKAHAHLAQYHGEAEFATWLLRIVTNECLMFLREKRRVRFVHLDDTSREADGPRLELPARGPDPEGEFGLNELKQILRTEVRRVPPLLRSVIMLSDIKELPMKDVAEVLQINVPAAKSRLLRARAEVRLRLTKRFNSTGAFVPPRLETTWRRMSSAKTKCWPN